MKLYRSYHTVINCSHLSTGITIIMKRIVPLSSQFPNGLLCKIVVYRKSPIIQVSKDFFPESIQIVKSFCVIPAFNLKTFFRKESTELNTRTILLSMIRPGTFVKSEGCSIDSPATPIVLYPSGQIFTAIHNYKKLFAAKIELSINSHFLTAYHILIFG